MVTEHGRIGRPRSEEARTAVLHAVDDLVVELGYGAVTLKGIAERAGVSRQTVYRWWSTKAEILLEASAIDARHELQVPPNDDPSDELVGYLDALIRFLTISDAGAAYRALIGEAQHDKAVGELLAGEDVLGDSAALVIERALSETDLRVPVAQATALLVGPVFFWVLSGRDPRDLDARGLVREFLHVVTLSSAGLPSNDGRRDCH